MNNPPYIFVDEVGNAVAAAKTALGLANINYQYGYITELKETMDEYSKTPTYAAKMFPLVFLLQPFTLTRGGLNSYYAEGNDLQLFIIKDTMQGWVASERMANNFKPILYPIYDELIRQFDLSQAFDTTGTEQTAHKVTDRYFWGEDEQKKILFDPFDCLHISGLQLKINNNLNCP